MGLRIDPQSTPVTPRYEASPRREHKPAEEKHEPPPLPRAGFGAGTASQATAAYVTLGRGLYSARQIVPTTQEIQAELRDKLKAIREQRETREAERTEQTLESRIPQASPKASAFTQKAAPEGAEPREKKTDSKAATTPSNEPAKPSTPTQQPERSTAPPGGVLNVAG